MRLMGLCPSPLVPGNSLLRDRGHCTGGQPQGAWGLSQTGGATLCRTIELTICSDAAHRRVILGRPGAPASPPPSWVLAPDRLRRHPSLFPFPPPLEMRGDSTALLWPLVGPAWQVSSPHPRLGLTLSTILGALEGVPKSFSPGTVQAAPKDERWEGRGGEGFPMAGPAVSAAANYNNEFKVRTLP